MSLHTRHHLGPCKPKSCTTFTFNFHWGRAATGEKKKSLASMRTGSLWSCLTLCNPVKCGLPGISVREGVLQARILEYIGQYWLPYPSAAAAKSLQSCPIMCDPIDGSPPGSPVPGIFQARTLEWVAIFFSNA